MSELPITYLLAVFLLGFLAGIITFSLFNQLRQTPDRESPAQDNLTESESENLQELTRIPIQPGTPPEVESSAPENTTSNQTSQPGATIPNERLQWVPERRKADVETVRPDPIIAIARQVQPASGYEKPGPTSMADEIDEILQEILASSDQAKRTIRLRSLPDQSLEVIVDTERYSGIDEVSDEVARKLIQQAVAEWQRRLSLK